MHPGGVVRFVRVRSVYSRTSWSSFASITVRTWGRRFRSGPFGQLPCALGIVVSCAFGLFPLVLGDVGLRSCAFCTFSCAHGFFLFVRVRSVDSRAPCGSSGPFWCFRPIHMRPGGHGVRSVHSRPLCGSSVSVGCVRSIPVRPDGRRMRWFDFQVPLGLSGSFGWFRPIPVCPGCRRMCSLRSRAPCGSSECLVCVRYIPMHPGGRWVLSCTFGQFLCALGVVVFVGMFSVHSLAPFGSSGSFGCVRSIHVRLKYVQSFPLHPGDPTVPFCPFQCALGAYGEFGHSRPPWGSSGSFGCVQSIPVCGSVCWRAP